MAEDTRFTDITSQLHDLTARVSRLEHRNARLSRRLRARTTQLTSVVQQLMSALQADSSHTDSDSENDDASVIATPANSALHPFKIEPHQQRSSSPTSMPPNTPVDGYSLSPELGSTTAKTPPVNSDSQTSPELSATADYRCNKSFPSPSRLLPQHKQTNASKPQALPAESPVKISLRQTLPVSDDDEDDEDCLIINLNPRCQQVAVDNEKRSSRSVTRSPGATNSAARTQDTRVTRRRQEEPPLSATSRRPSMSTSRSKSRHTHSPCSRSRDRHRRLSREMVRPPRYGRSSRSPSVSMEQRRDYPVRSGKSRDRNYRRSRSPSHTRYNRNRSRSPNRSGGLVRRRTTGQSRRTDPLRSPARRRDSNQGRAGNGNSNSREWQVIDFMPEYVANPATNANGWDVSGGNSLSSSSKVIEWKQNNDDISAMAMSPGRTNTAATAVEDSELALVVRSGTDMHAGHGFGLGVAMPSENGDDDDDDDEYEDPGWELLSPEKQKEGREAIEILDDSGSPVLLPRLLSVWSVCALVPLNDLSMLYEREHKVPLWTDANKKRMQRAIQQKFEENLAITQVRSNDRQTRFLLNRKCQLKSDRAYKRVVASRGTENQLYFYMATTVLWAANYSSSAIIYNLWVGILDDLPERVRSVGGSSTTGAHEPAFRTLWSNAIDWLVKLADYVTKHGPKHLINKAPQSGWDSGGVSGGPPLELIEGLARDDVCGLLKVLPILLDKQLPQNKKMDLSDELDRFFHG